MGHWLPTLLLGVLVLAVGPGCALTPPQPPGPAPVPASPAMPAEAEARLEAARQKGWADRLDAAIADLERLLRDYPRYHEARVQLAEFLSWNGALRRAGAEAEQVLERHPDHPGALRVRADAAAWSGDFATALPMYRRLIGLDDRFEHRLAYAQALASAGLLDQAEDARSSLYPRTIERGRELRGLVERLERARRSELRIGGGRQEDSDDSRRTEIRAGASTVVGESRVGVAAESVRAFDPSRTAWAHTALGTLDLPAGPWFRLALGGGATRVHDASDDTYPVGYGLLRGQAGGLRYLGRLEHSVFDETALLLSNRIRITEAELGLTYVVLDRFWVAGNLEGVDYSDDNRSWEAELTPQVVLRLGNPGLRLGYRRTWRQFERQSGGGYFDPDRFHSDLAVLFATLFKERVRGDLEFYLGRQQVERFGVTTEDFIVGGSARLGVDLTSWLALETEVEGGNFDITTSDGFKYWLGRADLVVRY